MAKNQAITLYRWILNQFIADGSRALEAVRLMGPELAPLIRPGDQVLDLCCGAGPWSFFFEERGATVLGIDLAPFMIEQARRDSERRGSKVEFVQTDVLTHDVGEDRFDLAVLMGNTLADLAPSDFVSLLKRIHRALKPIGKFAMQYRDGVAYFEAERLQEEGVEQEEPVRITRRYKEHRPEEAAWVVTYTNESTGETYDYTSYIYPAGLLRALMAPWFGLTRSTRISESSFLDVFAKQHS